MEKVEEFRLHARNFSQETKKLRLWVPAHTTQPQIGRPSVRLGVGRHKRNST